LGIFVRDLGGKTTGLKSKKSGLKVVWKRKKVVWKWFGKGKKWFEKVKERSRERGQLVGGAGKPVAVGRMDL
jgi:hypothetical protein